MMFAQKLILITLCGLVSSVPYLRGGNAPLSGGITLDNRRLSLDNNVAKSIHQAKQDALGVAEEAHVSRSSLDTLIRSIIGDKEARAAGRSLEEDGGEEGEGEGEGDRDEEDEKDRDEEEHGAC